MIKCNCCGRENSDYAIYCEGCGSLLSSISDSTDINTASPEVDTASSEPEVSTPVETSEQPAQSYQQPTQDYIPPEYTYTSTPATTNGMEFDGMCIAGFALAVGGAFCCAIPSVVGLILCIIGLARTKSNNKRGRSLAIAGIIISLLVILFWIIAIASGNGVSYSYHTSGRRR